MSKELNTDDPNRNPITFQNHHNNNIPTEQIGLNSQTPSISSSPSPSTSSPSPSSSSSSCFTEQILHPIQKVPKRFIQLYHQLSTSEISGSLGDLGTLIPLMVAMSRQRAILLPPALFFAGLSNILTGFTWDVPMCVQPMKSIAALAIADHLSQKEVTAAGIWTGGVMLILGMTGLIEVVNQIITGNVVSGIQMGVGIKLAGTGLKMVQNLGWLGEKNSGLISENGTRSLDSILLAIVCFILVLHWLHVNNNAASYHRNTNRGREEEVEEEHDAQQGENANAKSYSCVPCFKLSPTFQHPVGVYLFMIGIIFATITLITTNNEDGQYDLPLGLYGAPIAVWALDSMTLSDWKTGFLEGAIPQLPLTTLNSVISVCALAHSLYPSSQTVSDDRNRSSMQHHSTITTTTTTTTNNLSLSLVPQKHIPSRKEVSISVGLINLLFCPFGSMPNCHGAGGLAAQHRLGARHGASVVFLGIGKMLLAIFFGKSALTLLDALPDSILGVMLIIAGVELTVTGIIFLVDYSVQRVHIAQRRKSTQWQQPHCMTRSHSNTNIHPIDEKGKEPQNRSKMDEESQLYPQQRLQPPPTAATHVWDADMKESLRRNAVVTIITVSVIIALGKTHYGALSGWVAHLIYNDGWSDLCQQTKHVYRNFVDRRRNEKQKSTSSNE